MSPPKINSKSAPSAGTKHSADDDDQHASGASPSKRTRRGPATPSKDSSESTLDDDMNGNLISAPTLDTDTQDKVGEGGAASDDQALGGSTVPGGVSSDNINDTASSSGKDKGKETLPDPRVTFKRLPWFSRDLMKRIPPMLLYSMPADTTYALSALPVDNLGWGETYASSAKLCLIGGSIPVTVWTVGIIDSLWFFTRGGDPAERVTVGVVPLTEHAMMVGRNILSRFSRPVSAVSSMLTHVSASRWMSLRMAGERANQVLEFDKVYDAKARYGAKNTMTQIEAQTLKKGDLVILEAQVSRYNSAPKPANSGKYNGKNLKPSEFTQYKATFDLMCVSLLETGPKIVDEDEVPTISDPTLSL